MKYMLQNSIQQNISTLLQPKASQLQIGLPSLKPDSLSAATAQKLPPLKTTVDGIKLQNGQVALPNVGKGVSIQMPKYQPVRFSGGSIQTIA
jgi:hypothetical protein